MSEAGDTPMSPAGPADQEPDADRRAGPARPWRLVGLSGIPLSLVIALLTRFDRVMLAALAGGVMLVGLASLVRGVVHGRDPTRRASPRLIRLDAVGRRRSLLTVVAGGGLLTAVRCPHLPPVAIAVAGACVTAGVWFALGANVADTAAAADAAGLEIASGTTWLAERRPVRRWRRRGESMPGQAPTRTLQRAIDAEARRGRREIGAAANRMLAAILILSAGFTAVAAAHGVIVVAGPVRDAGSAALDKGLEKLGLDDDEDDDPKDETLGRQSYADACPDLPDPLTIGHGLGELFRHDGAVQAGCGQAARQVGLTEVWFAPGDCEGHLRSVAVSAPGRPPVLLYGLAARFALGQGEAGTLTFAERLDVAGGEVDLVGTSDGTHAFARSTPTLRRGRGEATRCWKVDEIAKPFVHVPPAMTELWLQLMARRGWVWPQADPGAGAFGVVFTDAPGGRVVAQAGCVTPIDCTLQGRDGPAMVPPSWRFRGRPAPTRADLARVAP
jgi:hypothetical protein